jgi:GNAT superfamily N-acetyltransferase
VSQVAVRVADAAEIRALRMAVLRPGWPVTPSDYDELPATRHVAAFDGDRVVACASVFPSPYQGIPNAWQLRGMAVAPDRQGTGLGAQVLLGAIDLVRVAGAPLLWANARVSALGFYERLGFDVVGQEFAHGPLELPHKVIVLTLDED